MTTLNEIKTKSSLNGDSLQKSSWSSKFGIHFYWVGNQNIAGNYTDITVDVYGWLDTYVYLDIGSRTGSINVAGNNDNVWMPAVTKDDDSAREIKLATRTVRVWHNDDGTLPNVYINAVWPIQATIDGVYRYDISCGFNTGEINRIPRASSISSNSSFTIGNDFPVAIKRASDSFKHDIYLKINNANFKTISKIDTNYTFTFNDEDIDKLYELTKNSSFIDCSLICDTFSDTTKIGTTTKNGKVYVDESSNKPTFENFTFAPLDLGTKELTGWTGPISDDNGLSIKSKTLYQITCEKATANNHATIVRYELYLNKKISSSTNEIINANSPIEYDDFLAVSAVDSRGFKTTISKKIVCQNYESIKPINAEIERQNYPDNTKVKIDFDGVISKSDTLNNAVKAYYRINDRSNYEDNYSDWKQIDIVVSNDGNISITDMIIDGFELDKVYDFELKINDYYSENIITTIITADKPIFSIKEDGIYTFHQRINVNKKNVITVYPGFNGTALNDTTFFPCQKISAQTGNNLSLENGKVVIGKGIDHVLVSAQVTDSSNNAHQKNLYIFKNDDQVVRAFISLGGMSYQPTISTAQKLIDVSEGDTISIWIHAPNTVFSGNENMTFLTVESI